MKSVRCSKSKCWLIFAKILEARLPVSLCHDHPFMSHDVREEVWDWLFKAAIKWKLPHERPRNSFCEAAIISELVSTTNSTSDFFHMWNIQSLESHCIKQDLNIFWFRSLTNNVNGIIGRLMLRHEPCCRPQGPSPKCSEWATLKPWPIKEEQVQNKERIDSLIRIEYHHPTIKSWSRVRTISQGATSLHDFKVGGPGQPNKQGSKIGKKEVTVMLCILRLAARADISTCNVERGR